MGLLLLAGACASPHRYRLQAWLGDAMEGPTPVSALIHAATMVTAGVYLIVRSNPLFNLAARRAAGRGHRRHRHPVVRGLIGCAKDDIKRALAASTMSQIGYMVLAAGLGPAGYAFAIMHLLTHGFFKAGLSSGQARSSTRCTKSRTCADTADCARLFRSRRHVRSGISGYHRRAAVRGLLLQGRDHRGGTWRRRCPGLRAGRCRAPRCGPLPRST